MLATCIQPLHQIHQREISKARKYRELIADLAGRLHFAPFVIDSYGSIGQQAERVIDDIAVQYHGQQGAFKQHLLNVLSVKTQKANAKMVFNGLARVHRAQLRHGLCQLGIRSQANAQQQQQHQTSPLELVFLNVEDMFDLSNTFVTRDDEDQNE